MNRLASSALAVRFRHDHQLWVELFAFANVGFLSLDIFMAHSENAFLQRPEYIPLVFSLVAPVLLAAGLVAAHRFGYRQIWRDLGYFVGAGSVVVGVAGVVYHLGSQFFFERTLRSLTYAAPFAAPLAYTGIGLLLIMNRMVKPDSIEWPHWVLLLTLGGFFGNFVLSLTDHAVNGFFRKAEWIPVIAAAFAIGFLALPFFIRITFHYVTACFWVLAAEAVVGVLGFFFHNEANIHGPSLSLFQNLINGAPPMAPLLFPNLAVLGFIGLWDLRQRLPQREMQPQSEPARG